MNDVVINGLYTIIISTLIEIIENKGLVIKEKDY